VGALPGDFQGDLVTARDGACHRAGVIRERRLPDLEELDDLLLTLDLPLGSSSSSGVGGELSSHKLPVAAVEGIHLLARDLDHLVCRLDLGKKCRSRLAPLVDHGTSGSLRKRVISGHESEF
jgi:hypothetical protein